MADVKLTFKWDEQGADTVLRVGTLDADVARVYEAADDRWICRIKVGAPYALAGGFASRELAMQAGERHLFKIFVLMQQHYHGLEPKDYYHGH